MAQSLTPPPPQIAEYWIVNLADDWIEVYREPRTFAGGAGEYRRREIARADDYVTPLNIPGCRLSVAEILPPREQ
ncbi:MAG: hypothetical protein U0641_11535 [Anaerolineae bacterium]